MMYAAELLGSNNLLLLRLTWGYDEGAMSKSVLVKLSETLAEQEAAVRETKAKMLSLLSADNSTSTVVIGPKATKKPRKTTTPKTDEAPAVDSVGSDRQASLKEVVLGILEKGPADLRGVVQEVTKMIQSGEYRSKAKKITPVVSQALFQLKQEALVAVEKSSDNRNLYSLSQAAAV